MRTKKTTHDMFGRPVEANSTFTAPVAPPPGGGSDQRPIEQRQKPTPPGPRGWGDQANLGLAGPPGRPQVLLADWWVQWWRPWALVGILLLGLVVAVILKVA